MGSYDLSPEQLTAILNDEAQKKRMRETAAEYREAVSLGMDADSAMKTAGPVSDLAGRYRRAIEFMPDPDTLAKDAQLAKDSGSPLALIQEDPEVRADAVRRQMFNKGKVPRHERMRQIEESLPATNRFLKRPGNLPFITDDPESLMRGEGILSTAVRGYLEGDLQQELGRLRASQLLGGGGKDVEDKVADVKSRLEEYGFERPERLGGRMFYGAGKLLAQRRDQIARGAAYAGLAAGAVGLAAATGGLSVPGTLMTAAGAYSGAAGLAANAARVGFVTGSAYEGFIQEAGLGYDELLEIRGENGEALDPAVARAGGLIIGAVNAGIEFAQLDMWLKSVPGVRRLISAGVMKRAAALPQVQGYLMAAGKAGMSYLKLLGAESAQEVVQQGTNIVVRNAAKALSDGSFKPDSASDVIAELVETFGSSAIEFSLGMLPGPLAGGVSDMRRIAATREYRINRAKGLASVQAMVNDAAKEGPLARRAPEKMREFLATVNDTIKNPFGEVYIDSGVIRTLMADRDYTEEERAVLLEDRLGVTQEEYKAAIESGAALSVRSENFAMLNEQDEELGALLFPELKADPDGVALKDVAAATEEHKASLRDELSFATRAAAASVSADDLKGWARREGLDRVYVDASAVRTLFQDAAPEEKARALEALGVTPADLEQAVTEGGDVEISLDRLFDSGVPNDLFDKIKDGLRAEPGAMTVRQAAAYAENGAPGTTRQETQAWKEKAERYVRDLEGAHRVKANLKAQLMLAGYGDDAAQASAEVFAARVMRSARRMGLDPETYFKMYANVKFVRGDVSGVNGVLNQDVKINRSDVEAVQRIGAKSVNDFSPDEVKNTSVWARKFQRELGVKSPFFRAWFGDWRANDKTKVEKVRLSGGDPKSMPRGSFVNKDTGWSIDVSRKVGEETRAHSGRDSRRTAISALADIEEIVKNAVLLDTSGAVEAGNKKKIDTAFMHHFYAVVNDGKNDILLKLFVDEMYNTQKDVGQRRAYELKAIKEIPSGVNRMTPADNGSGPTAPDGKYRVADLFNIVKANDGSFNPKDASKVVDANGEPLVVYHGSKTGGGFSVFEGPSFFTDDFDTADMFKSEADYELYINGRNIGLLDGADADDLSYLLLAGDYSPEEISEGGFVIDEDIHDADGLSEFLEEKFSYGFSEGDRIELKRTPGVYGCFLNIRNPLVVDFEGRVWGERVEDRPEAFFEHARNEGHDGVIVRNIVEGGLSGELRDGGEPRASTVFVTFDPEQVKSVENTGTFDAGNPNIYLQPVWHGSPYKFDKFSTEHIGEGEGAQAFGWGLYFAGNKEVSEWYRKKLSRGVRSVKIMFGDEEYRPASASTSVYDFLYTNAVLPKEYVLKILKERLELNPKLSLERALIFVRDELRPYATGLPVQKDDTDDDYIPSKRIRKKAQKILRWLDENEKSISMVEVGNQGQLFKVDIPDEADGNYLLWDTAVTEEQAERTFKALEERGAPLVDSLIFNGRSLAGMDYGEMIDEFGEAGAAVLTRIRTKVYYGDSLSDAINDTRSRYERDVALAGDIGGRSKEEAAMLSEQALAARDRLAWLEANMDSLSVSSYSPKEFVEMWGERGRIFYEKLSDMLGSDKDASMLLRDAGFSGIKYLDGSSRRRGEGSYNYVIFDDNAVNILETYYQAQNLVKEVERVIDVSKSDKETLASANLGSAGEWLVRLAEENAVKIDGGYIHSIDSYMMRHAMKEHGDAQRERSRGQIALTEEDFKLVPVIINNPDYVVFGNKNKRGQDLIVYVKNLPDGSTLYFEEVRTGRRKLAGESLRKASGASSEESLRRSLSPNARNDAGLPLKIIANPNPKGNELTQAVDDVYQQARGAISIPHTFGEGSLIQITITPNADASTAVHEMSHYFLWEMERLAQLLPHDAELQADLATTKKWLGWREGQTDWTREQQEQWARGFEAYLREGRAPSVELARAFARFKKWLCEIYKSITELGVELSDDMRGVFDRLLASEEETEAVFMMGDAAEGEGSVVDRIVAAHGDRKRRERADEVKAGVLARILKAAEERRAKEKSASAAEARARIEEEVLSMPAYRAKAAMSARMKLSAERLAADYGNDVFEGLPKDIFGSDGKFSADEVAAEFGYGSGDEMLSAVREAPAPADEVQARFEAEFGAEAPARDDARSAAEEAAYGDESVADLAAERYEIDEASRTSDEEWAMIEAEDEAARAAWDDPRSRPNCVRWIRENGGLSYASVKLVFGDEQAQELLKRCGPGLFKGGALSLDVAAESMKNEGAYFGMGPVNADQELFDVLMGDDPPVSPLEIAKREGFAEARAYARRRAEARRAGKAAKAAEREAERAAAFFAREGAAADKAEARRARKAAKAAEREAERAAAFFARESAAADKAEARAEAKAAREYIKNRAAADAEAVLAAARENVDRMRHTKLYDKVKVYKAAEEAARRQYRAAIKGRDWEAAKKGKDREMLNRALLVEAKKAIKMVENARERIINQLERSRKHTGGMPQDWIDQIDLLFVRFGIKEASPRINAVPGLDSFCRAEDEAGRPVPTAAWLRAGVGPKFWTEFTVGQFRDFDDTLAWLVHGGREAGRLSKEFATRNLGETATKLAAHIRSNLSKLIEANDERARESKTFDETRRDRLRRMFSAAGASMAKIEMVTHVLDAGRRGGYAWETISCPLADAENRENAMMRRYTADFESLLNKAYTKKERKALYKKKYYKLVDKNLSKVEVLCIALNTGNKVNLERVTTGFDWSEQQLRYVIESTLGGRDWDFVQGTWDLIDTLWPQIAALQRDMVGWLPERVQPLAQTWHMKDDKGTKGRTIRGGYYPIAYNRNAKQNRFIRMVSEQQMMEDLYGGYWSMAQTKQGHTEARVRSTGFELRLDLGVANEHIANVVHDLCYRKAIADVNKILTYYYRDEAGKVHRPVQEAIVSSMGEKIYDQFRPWLRYVASGDGLPPNDFAAVFRWLRRRSQVVVLGLKAAVSLSQMLGWLPAMHEVGVVPLVKNIMYFYRNPFALKERAAEVFAKSEAMRSRATSRDRDLRSLVNDLHRDNKYHSFQEACFWFINLFDAGVTLPIWVTAYEKGLKEYGWDETKAVAYADSVVRTTQDIGTAKDLSAIQRGGDIQKIFTMFYNAMNTQANMLMEDIWLYRAGHVSKGHLLGTFMYVVALPAIMGALLSGQGPEDEDDPEKGLLAQMFDDPSHVALWAAGEAAKYPFGFVPVLRDFASMAFDGYGFRSSAALSPVEQAGKTAITYGKELKKWRDDDEVDWHKVSMSTLLLGGYAFGLPAGQAKITIDAFLDWMEGEKEVRARDFFLYRKR